MNAAAKVSRPLGFAAGFAAAPLVYALVRVVALRMEPEADPAAVIWAEHSATVTRLVVTLYVGVAVLGGAVSLASAAPRVMPRVVGAVALVAALAVLVQTAWAP